MKVRDHLKLATFLCYFSGSLLAAPVLKASEPEIAQTNRLSDIKSVSDADLEEKLKTVMDDGVPDYCNVIGPIIAEMIERGSFSGVIKLQKSHADFQCAITERRWADAYQKMLVFEELVGRSMGSFGFTIAQIADQNMAAVARLERIASDPDNKEFLALDMNSVFAVSSSLSRNKQVKANKRMWMAMYESESFNQLGAGLKSDVAAILLEIDADRGQFQKASEYVGLLANIHIFPDMLAERKYERIWSVLEQAAGTNMSIMANKAVVEASDRYMANKEDRQAFQQAVHSLHFAGKFEEAVKLAQTFDHSPDNILKMTEDDAWALNVEAYSLDSMGQTADAERVFDLIASIPYRPQENGWLVNFVINRASRLVETGNWQKGYDAALIAENVTEKSGSPFAKMLVGQAKACALIKLGRMKEAAPIVDALFQKRKDAYSAAASAMLCADDENRAAAVVIDALKDKDGDGQVVRDIQKREFQMFYTRSALPRLRDRLRNRPDVSAAFNKVARDIPDNMMPLAGTRREQLKRPIANLDVI